MLNKLKKFYNDASEAITTVRELKENGITFSDVKKIINGEASLLKGRVVIQDDLTGEIVLDKHNLIVMRGRAFALEKIFDTPNELDMGFNTISLATKKICLFKVGNGGCIPGQPFNLDNTAVTTNDTDLANPIPFRLKIDGMNKPEGYYDLKDLNDGSGYQGYFAKKFDTIEWIKSDTTADEVAVKLTLSLSEDDFKTIVSKDVNGMDVFNRSTFINELGLCIANVVETDTTNTMKNIELVTHINFESEAYYNSLKKSTIYYYIYA